MAIRTDLAGIKESERKRKGPWTLEEDMRLISYISMHGEGRWDFLAKAAGLKRNGRSCRLRWINYLRPDLNHTAITTEEERLIIELHARWGNKWSRIAESLPGRTDNAIKNYWRTHINKKNHLQEICSTMHDDQEAESNEPVGLDRNNNETPFISFPMETEDGQCMSAYPDPDQYACTSCQSQPIPICDRIYQFGLNGEYSYPYDDIHSGAVCTVQEGLEGMPYSTEFANYNFPIESPALFELYASENLPGALHNVTSSPAAFSHTELYSDELWKIDGQHNQFIHSGYEDALSLHEIFLLRTM